MNSPSAHESIRAGLLILTAIGLSAGGPACRDKGAAKVTGAGSGPATSASSSRGTGRLVGRVRWKDDGQPAAGAGVMALLRPEALNPLGGDVGSHLGRPPEFTATDQFGQYEMSGLIPGEYTVWAFPMPSIPQTGVDAGRVATIGSRWSRKDAQHLVPVCGSVQHDLQVARPRASQGEGP